MKNYTLSLRKDGGVNYVPTGWWRVRFGSRYGGSRAEKLKRLRISSDDTLAPNNHQLNPFGRGQVYASFPRSLYPRQKDLPMFRKEIPIWTREQLLTFRGNDGATHLQAEAAAKTTADDLV